MKRFGSIVLAFLLVFGLSGCEEEEGLITDNPNARFKFKIDGQTVTFTNYSLNADTYFWDFGDGNSSSETSPVHSYSQGGAYQVTLTVSNDRGDATDVESFTIEDPFNISTLVGAGTWKVQSEAGAMAVGPTKGSTQYWSLPAEELGLRSCSLDDEYVFGADGSFSIELQNETFLEEWQGGFDDCGTPVAPHDGTGSYTFELSGNNLTIKGEGVFIGLPKVGNGGELPDVDVPSEITYEVVDFQTVGTRRAMTLSIESGSGIFWTFKLISDL